VESIYIYIYIYLYIVYWLLSHVNFPWFRHMYMECNLAINFNDNTNKWKYLQFYMICARICTYIHENLVESAEEENRTTCNTLSSCWHAFLEDGEIVK